MRRTKVSLNVIAFDSTFKLIDQALEQGVNLQEVRHSCACWQSLCLPPTVRHHVRPKCSSCVRRP